MALLSNHRPSTNTEQLWPDDHQAGVVEADGCTGTQISHLSPVSGCRSLMVLAANVRKLQVGRAAIDCGNACSGFGVDMKGRGCSGRREDKGMLRLIGTQSGSILPAKEVLLGVAAT